MLEECSAKAPPVHLNAYRDVPPTRVLRPISPVHQDLERLPDQVEGHPLGLE